MCMMEEFGGDGAGMNWEGEGREKPQNSLNCGFKSLSLNLHLYLSHNVPLTKLFFIEDRE